MVHWPVSLVLVWLTMPLWLTVPTYDGREKFKTNGFWEIPYNENIKEGNTVTVLFTIKRGTLAAKAKDAADLPQGVSFALYLYILAIIILDEPAERITNDAPDQPPEAFWGT